MSAAEDHRTFQDRRVLVVSTNYAPELTGIGPYATQLAEHWAASGAGVQVLTGMPHYPSWRTDERYRGSGGPARPAPESPSTAAGTTYRPVRAPCAGPRSRRRCWPTVSSLRRPAAPTP
ncbi:hypothetical protein Sfulv_47610 [Streptomyces fulvorobeus]|uniref:Glycosyltransferase subfamily 4-like N-terminal domain-containing protein n=1 Tax=Streptomyces fulvorobeus TaxID=284028 RepID=A0A7J0CBP6_9ACTN|nr:hypothetical protein Sfulv_47610 [Streptomyces fulvorobeus]